MSAAGQSRDGAPEVLFEVRHGAPEADELAALVVVLALRLAARPAAGAGPAGAGPADAPDAALGGARDAGPAAVWHRFAGGRPGPHWRAAAQPGAVAWRTAA